MLAALISMLVAAVELAAVRLLQVVMVVERQA
jgi:hypothetical protein